MPYAVNDVVHIFIVGISCRSIPEIQRKIGWNIEETRKENTENLAQFVAL